MPDETFIQLTEEQKQQMKQATGQEHDQIKVETVGVRLTPTVLAKKAAPKRVLAKKVVAKRVAPKRVMAKKAAPKRVAMKKAAL